MTKWKLLLGLLLVQMWAMAQMVPDSWEDDLRKRHPRATSVDWISGEEFYTADFQEGDRHMMAFYDQNGQWMKTQMEVLVSELPESLTEKIGPGYKIKKAYKVVSMQKPAGNYILELEAAFSDQGELLLLKE